MNGTTRKCCRGVACFIQTVIFAVFLLCTVSAAYAQSSAFATITGRALDPKGASVPNATVTPKNPETGITRTTETTNDGLFRFENLTPGLYDISLKAAGLRSAGRKRGM